ncbi:MAG: STAS domain-containing protein [Spirochaetales bacterium]|nr:STAS domain-containing protein [Spirochaetales bacterium]
MRFVIKEISTREIILEVHGTLMGMEATESFEDQLRKLEEKNRKIITLNFTDVDSINSSCIGKIFLYQKRLEEAGRTIKIRGCSDSLLKTFQLIKLERLISIEREYHEDSDYHTDANS